MLELLETIGNSAFLILSVYPRFAMHHNRKWGGRGSPALQIEMDTFLLLKCGSSFIDFPFMYFMSGRSEGHLIKFYLMDFKDIQTNILNQVCTFGFLVFTFVIDTHIPWMYLIKQFKTQSVCLCPFPLVITNMFILFFKKNVNRSVCSFSFLFFFVTTIMLILLETKRNNVNRSWLIQEKSN